VRRSSRVGALERLISLVCVYPFRCQRCAHRFRALHWGHRYPHSKGDRRDYERVGVRLPATLTAGTETFEALTVDLSVGGCAVLTTAPFPPGTEVTMTVRLGDAPVEVAEAVVRAFHAGRASLQFTHVGVDEQRRLAEFIHGLALPTGGRPHRPPGLPVEVALVAVGGLLVILLILSMVNRIGGPLR
jgi:hypothetical protein